MFPGDVTGKHKMFPGDVTGEHKMFPVGNIVYVYEWETLEYKC